MPNSARLRCVASCAAFLAVVTCTQKSAPDGAATAARENMSQPEIKAPLSPDLKKYPESVTADHAALTMRGIRKRFGAVIALGGVDLDVQPGEVHALIGENGAGKSTLMKILSGAYAPDAGQMTLAGRPYAPKDPLEGRNLGVAMIYQELTLAPHLTVAQNIVLSREPCRFGIVDRTAMRARVDRALAWLDQPDLDPNRLVSTLSPGSRQLVEIARALAGDARVVVMDEPTSSLSRPEAERLFVVIDRLRQRDVGIVYISHFLEEVRQVAQRYTVLRDGRSVERGEVSPRTDDATFIPRIIEAMAGRSITETYPRLPHERGEPVLELEDLCGTRLPNRAQLTLHRGEILGIAGLVGAGRTEMLRALFGLDAVRSGRVRVGAVWDHGCPPWERLRQGIGLLAEDRKEEGLALGMSISDNLTLSRPVARFGIISRMAHDQATQRFAAQLNLRHRGPSQPVGQLSGGNQQKVAVARLLHHDTDIFLFDEPTRGVDVGSKAEIYRLIGELAQRGKAILFVSSYLPELLGICDRIAVMNRGTLGDARPADAWTEVSLLDAAISEARG